MQNHYAFHHDCNGHHNMTSVNQSQSQFGPSIEDRLENTEKLIREMNYKFEDITSTKHSAKNEFNKLVQKLTMKSALNEYNMSDSGNEADFNDDQDSQNSSFDEETMNLNHQNLKQFLYKNNAKQEGKYMKQSHPDKAQFSNSRYEHAEEEDDLDQYYNPHTRSYAVPEGKIDLKNYKNQENNSDEVNSEQLYQNAKNSLNRTKILMMASQQDNDFINEMSFSDTENQIEMLNLSSKRVEKILRNKEKRKTKESSKPQYTYENMPIEDSDSCKIQASSEQDEDNNEDLKELHHQVSRNKTNNRLAMSKDTYEGRYVNQTTSSANLVLYDSVAARTSTQSPQEMFDPNFIQKVTGKHMKVYQHHDEEDLLQNEGVAGKNLTLIVLDETYPRYYGTQSNSDIDENMADCDEDYDDTNEMDLKGRKHIVQYVHQLSGSKFKY